MSEREQREGEPQGSSSFMRPFQEKLSAAWRWITFQEAPVVETPVQPKVEPKVETRRLETPRYMPRPIPRQYGIEKARPSERRSAWRPEERRQPVDSDHGSDLIQNVLIWQTLNESNRSSECESSSRSHESSQSDHGRSYDSGHSSSSSSHSSYDSGSNHSSGSSSYDSGSSSSSFDSGSY